MNLVPLPLPLPPMTGVNIQECDTVVSLSAEQSGADEQELIWSPQPPGDLSDFAAKPRCCTSGDYFTDPCEPLVGGAGGGETQISLH
jgi:hypothetical protein